MQTDRKKLGIFIIVISLIIIILIIYFVFLRKSMPTPIVENPVNTGTIGQLATSSTVGTTTPSDTPRTGIYNVAAEETHTTNANDLGKISMAFAERFGSFSNQSNYSNFNDLKIMMTDSMKTWADRYVADLKTQPQSKNVYYGITTTAIIFEVKKFDDAAGQAEILVTTQRRESTESINGGTPFMQKLDLKLDKVNGDWLFNSASWLNR